MRNEWNWTTASADERADMVRQHANASRPRPFTPKELCDLFNLTYAGLEAIVAGDIWRPHYQLRIEA